MLHKHGKLFGMTPPKKLNDLCYALMSFHSKEQVSMMEDKSSVSSSFKVDSSEGKGFKDKGKERGNYKENPRMKLYHLLAKENPRMLKRGTSRKRRDKYADFARVKTIMKKTVSTRSLGILRQRTNDLISNLMARTILLLYVVNVLLLGILINIHFGTWILELHIM